MDHRYGCYPLSSSSLSKLASEGERSSLVVYELSLIELSQSCFLFRSLCLHGGSGGVIRVSSAALPVRALFPELFWSLPVSCMHHALPRGQSCSNRLSDRRSLSSRRRTRAPHVFLTVTTRGQRWCYDVSLRLACHVVRSLSDGNVPVKCSRLILGWLFHRASRVLSSGYTWMVFAPPGSMTGVPLACP